MIQIPQAMRGKKLKPFSAFSVTGGSSLGLTSFARPRANQVHPNHGQGTSAEAGGARSSGAGTDEGGEGDGEVVGTAKRRSLFATRGGRGRPPNQYDALTREYKEAKARGEVYTSGGQKKNGWEISRRFLYRLLDEPDSSRAASVIAWFIFSLILMSTATFCVETLPEIQRDCHAMAVIYYLDVTAVSVFTLEYILRWYASANRLTFPIFLKNIIDILAIAPFYLSPLPPLCEQGVVLGRSSPLAVVDLRFLRLLRVFRTFKLSGYGPQLELVVSAVRESKEMLMMFLINLMIVIIVFSSIAYFAERGQNEDFSSIPASCWWAIVTVLTVGYGDMAPTTVTGKLVASLLMVIALVVIALPVSIIGTNFTLEWERFKEEQKAVLRAMKLPGKLKQAYPSLEMWMEDLNQHCYSLRKETASMRKLSKELQKALPENQMSMLEEIMKSAEALKALIQEDISTSTTSIAKMLKRIQETQERLTALNKEAKSCLRQSLRAVQKSFSGACLLQTPGDPKEHNGLKDLRRYGGFVLLNIIGCKGLPVNNKLADIPDAYVAVSSGVESVKTSVVNNSSSPYFDETLLLLVDDPEVPISVDVFDKEMFSKDEFLGSCKITLPWAPADSTPRDPLATWKPMAMNLEGSAKDCGILMMQYAFYELRSLTEEQLANPDLWPRLMQLTTSIDVPSIVSKDVLEEIAQLTESTAEDGGNARHPGEPSASISSSHPGCPADSMDLMGTYGSTSRGQDASFLGDTVTTSGTGRLSTSLLPVRGAPPEFRPLLEDTLTGSIVSSDGHISPFGSLLPMANPAPVSARFSGELLPTAPHEPPSPLPGGASPTPAAAESNDARAVAGRSSAESTLGGYPQNVPPLRDKSALSPCGDATNTPAGSPTVAIPENPHPESGLRQQDR